jgi:hypothetical protein
MDALQHTERRPASIPIAIPSPPTAPAELVGTASSR